MYRYGRHRTYRCFSPNLRSYTKKKFHTFALFHTTGFTVAIRLPIKGFATRVMGARPTIWSPHAL
jgi:hypothetical protein